MTRFEESRLRFEFGPSWQVRDWDGHGFYRRYSTQLPETKGVDFVGARGGELWLIEVKNFRGHHLANRERLQEALALEVAHKARDSIAGLVGVAQTEPTSERWQPFTEPLTRRRRVRVVLWLETDPGLKNKHDKRALLGINGDLKRRLSWLTRSVFVVNGEQNALNGVLEDLDVSGLPAS